MYNNLENISNNALMDVGLKNESGLIIGLYGISGLYNYGCEAIVRGTVHILRQLCPSCQIIYFSRMSQEDRLVIDDLGIEVVQITRKADLFCRIINKVMQQFRLRLRIPFDDYKKICMKVDVVFSIGGDIYTIPKAAIVDENYVCHNRLVQFGEYALTRGKKIVIFGASIGPFGLISGNIKYFMCHFNKASYIVCREEISIEYLRKYIITQNVEMFPDPAFFVLDDKDYSYQKCGYIGLNLSEFSCKVFFGDLDTKKKQNIAELICKIIKHTGRKILLIPHVVLKTDRLDNDLIFLKDLYSFVPNEYRSSVILIDNCPSFIATKRILRKCDMVIAARMHCAINALSEGVPSILLSYSEKSKGVAEYIYGSRKWVISIGDIEEKLLALTLDMLKQLGTLEKCINEKIVFIRSDNSYREVKAKLRNLIMKSGL